MRFRKSISLGKGMRINLSKSGIGMSAGTKGFRVGVGPKGTYRSVGIPGTGLYSIDYVKSGRRSKKESAATATVPSPESTRSLASQLYLEMPTPQQIGLSVPHTLGCWVTAAIVTLLFRPWGPYAGAVLIGLWALNLNREPVRLGKLYGQARTRVIEGRYQEALGLLGSLAGKVPPHLLELAEGHCCFGAGDEAGAIEHYLGHLESAASKDPAVTLRCSSLLLKNSRPVDALRLLEHLPEPYRADVTVIGMKGACLLEDGKPELAVEVLKTAPLRKRTPDPVLTAVRYTLAKAYQSLGQGKKAATLFRRVYADDPTFEDIREIVALAPSGSDDDAEPEPQ